MLKKTKLIVSLAILTIIATMFTGCFLFNASGIKSITLVGQPKTEYTVGESFDANFKIKVSYTDASKDVELNYNNDQVEFENDFSSAVAGTYTCTISVKGQKGITYSFSYSVVASGSVFTRGTGSKADPYIVTTATQFTHIAEEDGKYYKLGNDIDLTNTQPTKLTYMKRNKIIQGYYSGYTTSLYPTVGLGEEQKTGGMHSFELDGQNYKVTLGGNESAALFVNVYNSTIKNMKVEYAAGSEDCSIAKFLYGDVTIENVETFGTMEVGSNGSAFIAYTWDVNNLYLTNCTNNVNLTGTAPYAAAFVGLGYEGNNITLTNCVNNGSIEGQSAFVYISNGALQFASIKVIGGANNGKLVGTGVGLFNIDGPNATTTRSTAADYAETSIKDTLTVNGFTADASKFVAISTYKKTATGKDVTLVNDNGTVKFNSELNLPTGYTVKAYVREWAPFSGNNDGTVYLYSQSFGLDFAVPYAMCELDESKTGTSEYDIFVEGGKLLVAKNASEGRYSLTKLYRTNDGKPQHQYYCYFIYDATGAMKYCGAIKYVDMQNA